jgi:hypothetical protein
MMKLPVQIRHLNEQESGRARPGRLMRARAWGEDERGCDRLVNCAGAAPVYPAPMMNWTEL